MSIRLLNKNYPPAWNKNYLSKEMKEIVEIAKPLISS